MALDVDLSGITLSGGNDRIALVCADCGGRLSWAPQDGPARTLAYAIEAISDHVRVNHPERVAIRT